MPDSDSPPSTVPANPHADCVCNETVDSAAAEARFGRVYPLVCFHHGIITPQAAKWLPTLPGRLFASGVAGASRSGKSFLENRKAEYHLAAFAARQPASHQEPGAAQPPGTPHLPKALDTFVESSLPIPQTRGMQALALPRRRADGDDEVDTELIIDAEGQDLGNTLDHRAVLGILSRIVTHLTYVEEGSFNYAAVRALGRLCASQLVVSNRVGAGSGQVPWPFLHILVNKRTLQAPVSDAAFIAEQLRDNTNDPSNNADRETVRRTWADPQRLLFSTVPVDPTVSLDAATLALLPEEARTRVRAPFLAALERWSNEALDNTAAFSWSFAAAVEGGAAVPTGEAAAVTGSQYAQFIDALIRAYAAAPPGGGGAIDPAGAVETAVQMYATQAVGAATTQYDTERQVEPHLLSTGRNDVDGARGTADDGQAAAILLDLQSRHNRLAALCQQQYDDAVSGYSGLGSRVDAVLTAAKTALTGALATKLSSLNAHWQQQRSINPALTSVENDTKDDPAFNAVHHVQSEQVWFHTNHHYFWATYVYRRSRTRTRSVRYNGDAVYSSWQVVGDPVRVQTAGPWHGGAP